MGAIKIKVLVSLLIIDIASRTFVDEKGDLVLELLPGTAIEKDQAPILNIIEVERTDQTEVAQHIEVPIRIGAYNVAVGAFGSAEDIGDELAQYDLDILGLNECPQLIDSSSNLPEWIEICWETTAENVAVDYMEEDGYYMRNC